jgi:conjugative relaxase-like TrwC/TraI family protein
VLGVHGVRRDGADYYLSDLGRELPVSVPPHWTGSAAAGLGLAGPLDPDGVRRLLGGQHPATGQPIGSSRVTVAAFDLTFSAPKSASVLFALAGPDAARQIVDAHEAAVAGGLAYLEQHGVSAVRRDAVIATSGMVAGSFTHAVSRNGDPHLHSHVVMANLVHGVDGRWTACDRRGLDAHRQAASSVYEAHLRAQLGVRWTTALPGRSAEIAGVGPELLGEFSSRGADIRRRMYETGTRSGRGRRVAWAATRPAKTPGLDYADAAREWRRRARDAGGPPELETVQREAHPVLDEHRVAAVLSLTPHGGARRRDVVAAFASGARDGVEADSVERLVALWVPPAPPGVAEPIHQRGDALPRTAHLRALGPRPVRPADHEVWMDAAQTIDAYRERWSVTRSDEPFGVGRDELAALGPARLADHLTTLRHVEVARARLGRREPVTVELGLGR